LGIEISASFPSLEKLSTILGPGYTLEANVYTDIPKKMELFILSRFLFSRKEFVRKVRAARQINEE
jgi:hypothetical protein